MHRQSVNLFAWLAAVLCIAALNPICAAAPSSQTHSGDVLSLSLRPKDGDKFEFGKVAEAVFTLRNQSDKAVVVLRVKPVANDGEEPIVLYGSEYGSLTYSDDEDVYRHDSMAQMATQRSLYRAFLLPHQAVSLTRRYRPLSESERFELAYAASSEEYDDRTESISPLRVYISSEDAGAHPFTAIYRPFAAEKWLKLCETALEAGAPHTSRAVIITGLPEETIAQAAELSIDFEGDGFVVESARNAAAKIMGSDPQGVALAYSAALGGYVVREKDGSWLLKTPDQDARGDALPAFDFAVLKDVDMTGSVVVRVGDKQEGPGGGREYADWKFWDLYPVYYGDGMYTRGEFIDIGKSELLAFLQRVREESGSLQQQKYFFDARYFVLDLPQRED